MNQLPPYAVLVDQIGYALSGVVHVALVLFLIFGVVIPHKTELFPSPTPIPVKFIKVGEFTAAPRTDVEPAPPAEAPKVQAAAETPPPPAPKPLQKTAEVPPMPQPKVAENPKEIEKAVELTTSSEPQPPSPPRTTETKKEKSNDFLKVLNTVSELQSKNKTPAPKTVTQKKTKDALRNPERVEDLLTLNEQDALRQQLRECWQIFSAAKEGQKLAADVEVTLDTDGMSVKNVIIVDTARAQKEPLFYAVASSGVRAVKMCSPLRLPEKKYSNQKMIFNFDPKEMFT